VPLAAVVNVAVVLGQLVTLINAVALVFVKTVNVAVFVTLVQYPVTSTV
jgi:hypothetical protein